MGQEVLQHFEMYSRVPYHTFFAHLFPTGLELGLDEAGDLTPLPQQAVQCREDQLQGDEGTSILAKSRGSGICSGVRYRALVRSMHTTRGSLRSFQSSWP